MPVFQLALPEELRTWDTSPLAWRWKYLAGLQGDFVQHARYFCALDEATDPNCVLKHPALQNGAGARRMQTMGPLKDFLHQRILLRSRSELDSALFRANSEQHCAARAAVLLFSQLQLALLRAFYGAPASDLELESVSWAYLMFASGELRVPVAGTRGIGEADSAFFFAFAEFALLACEHDIEAQTWERVLRPFVAAQGVYVHMQRPLGPRPSPFHKYAPRGSERVFTLAVANDSRARVRHAHTREELAAVHTANCIDAFAI
jgi:hypothetical protein